MQHKEYGGYIELDRYGGVEYHSSAIALNCGRNALAYLIEARQIRHIYLPYYLCASVSNVCRKHGVEVTYYHVDRSFRPILDTWLPDDAYLYLVNYYGQFSNDELLRWKECCPRLIVDNAQAYFQMPTANTDTLYTCRKYFGVADGAYLYTDATLHQALETDCSYERMHFLLGRFEKGANAFYAEYVDNNRLFRDEPIKAMSLLTHNLLRGIDYQAALQQRTDNFAALAGYFGALNPLQLTVPKGAFMYPLFVENGSAVRKALQQKKIYIPTLWPDVFDICGEHDLEYDLVKNILPIPVDQRYDQEDMAYLAETVMAVIRRGDKHEYLW